MNEPKLKRNLPVANFFYRGTSHSHPVRRTVLRIDENADMITGYEIRNGRQVITDLSEAPIKSYRKDRIANYGDYQKLNRYAIHKALKGQTTLSRAPLKSVKINIPSSK